MGVFISRTGIGISMMAMNMERQKSCIRSAVCGPDTASVRLGGHIRELAGWGSTSPNPSWTACTSGLQLVSRLSGSISDCRRCVRVCGRAWNVHASRQSRRPTGKKRCIGRTSFGRCGGPVGAWSDRWPVGKGMSTPAGVPAGGPTGAWCDRASLRGAAMGQLWDNYGTTMGQLWDNYGTTYGTTLKPCIFLALAHLGSPKRKTLIFLPKIAKCTKTCRK